MHAVSISLDRNASESGSLDSKPLPMYPPLFIGAEQRPRRGATTQKKESERQSIAASTHLLGQGNIRESLRARTPQQTCSHVGRPSILIIKRPFPPSSPLLSSTNYTPEAFYRYFEAHDCFEVYVSNQGVRTFSVRLASLSCPVRVRWRVEPTSRVLITSRVRRRSRAPRPTTSCFDRHW